jgi:hypothetical protein
VLKGEPDWARLPASTPSTIEKLLRRCLRRERTDRLRDIGDACLEIADVLTGRPEAGTSRRRRIPIRELGAWSPASVAVLAAVVIGMRAGPSRFRVR